jgi:hypothetical protein
MPPSYVRLDAGEYEDAVPPAQTFSLPPWVDVYEAEIKFWSASIYF